MSVFHQHKLPQRFLWTLYTDRNEEKPAVFLSSRRLYSLSPQSRDYLCLDFFWHIHSVVYPVRSVVLASAEGGGTVSLDAVGGWGYLFSSVPALFFCFAAAFANGFLSAACIVLVIVFLYQYQKAPPAQRSSALAAVIVSFVVFIGSVLVYIPCLTAFYTMFSPSILQASGRRRRAISSRFYVP